MNPSKSCGQSAAPEHRVERRARDLREPRDLGLGHPGSDCHVGEPPDGFALLLRLAAGGESGAAVGGEFGAERFEGVGHSCIVLDNGAAA